MPPSGHVPWAEVGGDITFVTSGENVWQLKKLSVSILGEAKNASLSGTAQSPWLKCIYWVRVASRRNCRQKPLFLFFWFFC